MYNSSSWNIRGGVPPSRLHLNTSGQSSSSPHLRELSWILFRKLCSVLNIAVARYRSALSIALAVSSTGCALVSTLSGTSLIAMSVDHLVYNCTDVLQYIRLKRVLHAPQLGFLIQVLQAVSTCWTASLCASWPRKVHSIPFPSFAIMYSFSSNSLVAFHQSVFKNFCGKPAKKCFLKRSVVGFLLLDQRRSDQSWEVKLCTPVHDPEGGLQWTVHNPPGLPLGKKLCGHSYCPVIDEMESQVCVYTLITDDKVPESLGNIYTAVLQAWESQTMIPRHRQDTAPCTPQIPDRLQSHFPCSIQWRGRGVGLSSDFRSTRVPTVGHRAAGRSDYRSPALPLQRWFRTRIRALSLKHLFETKASSEAEAKSLSLMCPLSMSHYLQWIFSTTEHGLQMLFEDCRVGVVDGRQRPIVLASLGKLEDREVEWAKGQILVTYIYKKDGSLLFTCMIIMPRRYKSSLLALFGCDSTFLDMGQPVLNYSMPGRWRWSIV